MLSHDVVLVRGLFPFEVHSVAPVAVETMRSLYDSVEQHK